jgi:hypothetical protein
MTAKTATRLLLAFGLICASVAAQADCRDDLVTLKARLAAANQKAPNVLAAKKEVAKADQEQKDELSCSNAVARAWRAYRAPPPAPVAAQQ